MFQKLGLKLAQDDFIKLRKNNRLKRMHADPRPVELLKSTQSEN